jgi:hypothetical protein
MIMRSALYCTDTPSWILYSVRSLKQQSADRHVAPVGHIILIPILSHKCCALSGEATNTNFIVFVLTRSGLEPTIFRTRREHANYYTTDVVGLKLVLNCSLHTNKITKCNNLLKSSKTRLWPFSLKQKWFHGHAVTYAQSRFHTFHSG